MPTRSITAGGGPVHLIRRIARPSPAGPVVVAQHRGQRRGHRRSTHRRRRPRGRAPAPGRRRAACRHGRSGWTARRHRSKSPEAATSADARGPVGRERDPVRQRRRRPRRARPDGPPTSDRSTRGSMPRRDRQAGRTRSTPCRRRGRRSRPGRCSSISSDDHLQRLLGPMRPRSRPSRTRSIPVNDPGCRGRVVDGPQLLVADSDPVLVDPVLEPPEPVRDVIRPRRRHRRRGSTGTACCSWPPLARGRVGLDHLGLTRRAVGALGEQRAIGQERAEGVAHRPDVTAYDRPRSTTERRDGDVDRRRRAA